MLERVYGKLSPEELSRRPLLHVPQPFRTASLMAVAGGTAGRAAVDALVDSGEAQPRISIRITCVH
jgi:hypothetical protein